MKMTTTLTALAAAVLLCATAQAAPKGQNMDREKAGASSPSSQAVETAATARSLARYGDANKDPLALITAAKLLKSAGVQDAPAGSKEPLKAADDTMTGDAMLARARTLAAGRPDLLALADDVAKSGSRGATGGPKYSRTVVKTRGTDQYNIRFIGSEPARVVAKGDGDSDLDLYVYDENGNLICKDDDGTDTMACGWTPRWSGSFSIRVVNRGIANQYEMLTN